MALAAARNIYPNPGSQGQRATCGGLLTAIPASPASRSWLCWKRGNPGGNTVRVQQPHVGHKNLQWKRGVRLPLVLKPIKRQGWRKGMFVLFQRPASRGRGAPVQKPTPHTDNRRVGGALIDGGRGYMQRQHSQFWESSRHWSCGDLIGCLRGSRDQYLISQACFFFNQLYPFC